MLLRSRVLNIFPPPRFLTLPSVGVDISESSLKYMQLRAQGASFAVQKWGDIPLASGIVVRGSIANMAGLADALKQVRAACGTPYIRVSLPEERAYLFETTIPRGVSEADIRNLLEFRMEENVPLSPRDAFFDYEVVADDTDGQLLHIAVAVYAKETIVSYDDACKKAKLMPLSFEVEADAIARAAIPEGEEGVCMILDVGRVRSGLGIVHKHALLYTATIDIGGQHFSDALKRQVGEQEDAVLTTLKNERGLLRASATDDVYETLLPTVSVLKDGIETCITYWNTRSIEPGARAIQKIILCGGSVNMAGLPEYLTEVLGIETQRVDVWRNVFLGMDVVPPIARRSAYGYATAVGLALRDSIEQKSL